MVKQKNMHQGENHISIFNLEESDPIDKKWLTKHILDAFPFYIILVDSDHHIIFANQAVETTLGIDPKEIIGGYCPRVIHGLSDPFPGCPLEEAVEKGKSIERELFDNNSERWFISSVYFTDLRTKGGKQIFLHTIQDITESKNAKDNLKQSYQKEEVLNQLLKISLSDSPLEKILDFAIGKITSIEWLALESKGAIFLIEENPKQLVLKANRGLGKLISKCALVPFGTCLCGRAAETGETVFADHIDERHDIYYDGITEHGHYCIPIKSPNGVVGVLTLYIKEKALRNDLTEGFLFAVSDILAGIIELKRTQANLSTSINKLRNALGGIIHALSATIETRDPYTAGHQQRVADLARNIATEMGLSADQIDGIRIAASLHDIGKIAIPVEILSKPGHLTAMEFDLIKTHVQKGYDILKKVNFNWPVAQIVLQHHEKFNGSGYPNKLLGKEMLIEARIIAVADTVEAISSNRPYRAAHGIDKALDEISNQSGILYDPEVCIACLTLFREKGFKLLEINL